MTTGPCPLSTSIPASVHTNVACFQNSIVISWHRIWLLYQQIYLFDGICPFGDGAGYCGSKLECSGRSLQLVWSWYTHSKLVTTCTSAGLLVQECWFTLFKLALLTCPVSLQLCSITIKSSNACFHRDITQFDLSCCMPNPGVSQGVPGHCQCSRIHWSRRHHCCSWRQWIGGRRFAEEDRNIRLHLTKIVYGAWSIVLHPGQSKDTGDGKLYDGAAFVKALYKHWSMKFMEITLATCAVVWFIRIVAWIFGVWACFHIIFLWSIWLLLAKTFTTVAHNLHYLCSDDAHNCICCKCLLSTESRLSVQIRIIHFTL